MRGRNKTRRGKRRFAGGTALLLAVSLLACAIHPMATVLAETLTNELIESSEKEKNAAEESKNALKNGLTNVQALINSLESEKNDLQGYITELDEDLAVINTKVDDLNDQIGIKEEQIKQTTLELAEAEKTADEQYELMKKRIKFMYERGEKSNLEMLLTAESFSDFLNKAEFISKISEYDRRLLDRFIESKEAVAEKKGELEEQSAQLLTTKENLQNEQEAMQILITNKEEEIAAYENDISNKEAAVREYEAEIAAQDQIIKDLEATILAEKKRLLEQNKKAIVYDGGKFAWPAPDYTRISDEYGMRMHPTLGIEKFHSGIDLASPSGSRILAAYDGEVVAANYSASMGNYVMIDHGDGLYTIYMHASKLLVSEGQLVVRGEQIAKVGSTGRSTGPHLHFGVRLDGEYVSPWNYLG
ncbi:MAG: peptidoglycan DD-metalloendopeptidase family protein [Lachnospiraceae bacterium]|nr:peptidoglycan DD-metalloendopeptidase family protein [Lachnospiraceae bacterium]